jgi:immune inhibitor A
MGKSGSSAGQYWKLTFHEGYYRLTNVSLGADLSLDTYSNGENAPFMAQSGNETGQRWHAIRLGDGYWRLTNDYLGGSRSLDTRGDSGHAPFMGRTSGATGQLWKLTKLSRQ